MRNGRLVTFALSTCLLLGSYAGSAWAGVSAEEAELLKTTLTPLGAERAGNADGTIPTWEGGFTTIPEGYEKNKPHVDPFAADKILFTITAANMDQYADKLSEGQKGLLKKFPDTYKINVYESRRTQSAPQWVYDETFKNATRAKLSDDGNGATNAWGGIIFPIPKNGNEAMYNFLSRWRGKFANYNFDNIIVPASGSAFVGSASIVNEKYQMYDQDLGFDGYNAQKTPLIWQVVNQFTGPPRKKGEIILGKDPVNMAETPRLAWQYLPGQRRVRRAPTLAYDTPNAGTQGLMTYDDTFMFNGGIDRYNWELVGKKEMYIPYNSYKQEEKLPVAEVYPPNHPNPDLWRWELHRVWVVEGTLKEGMRHVYQKRVNYLDEDSWTMPMRDVYDAQGSLWRTAYSSLKQAYELPGVVEMPSIYLDFYAPEYLVNFSMQNYDTIIDYEKTYPEKHWSPGNVRRLGKR